MREKRVFKTPEEQVCYYLCKEFNCYFTHRNLDCGNGKNPCDTVKYIANIIKGNAYKNPPIYKEEGE